MRVTSSLPQEGWPSAAIEVSARTETECGQHLDWKPFAMKILTKWLRGYVPGIAVDDHRLAEDLTLRGIAVEGVHDLGRSAAGSRMGICSRWTSPPTAWMR
jgi:hypothetical protein